MSLPPGRRGGWEDRPREVEWVLAQMPNPVLSYAAPWLSGTGAGKTTLLFKAMQSLRPGGYWIGDQGQYGTCVSFGFAGAAMLAYAVEIAVKGEAERWEGDFATEPIYGGSRVQVGGGRLGGDGSIGAWAAKWLTSWGVAVRKRYDAADLTNYSGSLSRTWGRRPGVPESIQAECRLHPVADCSLVTTYEQARDAIANGYPVAVCSNQGFTTRRDAQGFCRPSGSWPHCMYFCACDDESGRPGLLCMNSWGAGWVSGPKRHDQPDGSFWVDASVCTRMLSGRDSFAIQGVTGWPGNNPVPPRPPGPFPPRPIDNTPW